MEFLKSLVGAGLNPKDLSSLQVMVRAVVMFFSALIMIRLGDKRFLSRKTPFDAVVGFILASMLARAVNGSASIVPTLAGGLILVLLHRFLAFLSSRFHSLSVLIKGRPNLIVQDGRVESDKLKVHSLSEGDLLEATCPSRISKEMARSASFRRSRTNLVFMWAGPSAL